MRKKASRKSKTERKANPFMRSILAVAISGVASLVHAGIIVPDLDDADALVTLTAQGTATDASGALANGMTLAVKYTASAGDISTSINGGDGDPDPIVIMEIGGHTSGSGLYIVDGAYWFISAVDTSSSTPVPTLDNGPAEDLNGVSENLLGGGFAGKGVSVRLGDAVAGAGDTMWASLDSANGKIYTSLNGEEQTFTLTGVDDTWNWEGDGTVGYLTANGQNGGLAVNGGAGPWRQARWNAGTGTADTAQYFNTVAIPEPATLGLISAFGIGTLFLRRLAM